MFFQPPCRAMCQISGSGFHDFLVKFHFRVMLVICLPAVRKSCGKEHISSRNFGKHRRKVFRRSRMHSHMFTLSRHVQFPHISYKIVHRLRIADQRRRSGKHRDRCRTAVHFRHGIHNLRQSLQNKLPFFLAVTAKRCV